MAKFNAKKITRIISLKVKISMFILFLKAQIVPIIRCIIQELGGKWRVSDCEELVCLHKVNYASDIFSIDFSHVPNKAPLCLFLILISPHSSNKVA